MKRVYVRNDLKKGIRIPQKHRRNSAQRFPKRRLVARLCPLCGKSLAIYTNSKTQKEFIGCSGYPSSCKFIEWKSVVDYACENIGIGIGWRPEIDRGAIN